MAQFLNVEKSEFINQNINIYSKNKVGQYSKFLDKTPMFVTYYSINQTMTRTDVGSGGIESELGKNSPVRFNKITNLPVYNMPTLKPDITYDETGYDIDLDLSDIVLLPNTVKPIGGDYMLIKLAGVDKEYLFRINNFAYNTIQSNDYYQIDLDIKDIGTDLEVGRGITYQIIDEYETIFDNIGTHDKCFVKSSDISKINDIAKCANVLKTYYISLFYNNLTNSFILPDPNSGDGACIYDLYLEKFITDSNIFYEPNDEKTLVLTPNASIPSDFRMMYMRSIYNAILTKDTSYLKQSLCKFIRPISKRFSPFVLNDINCFSTCLVILDEDSSDKLNCRYTDKELLDALSTKSYTGENIIYQIMCDYMFNNIDNNININSVISTFKENDAEALYYIPIIVYIFNSMTSEYLK